MVQLEINRTTDFEKPGGFEDGIVRTVSENGRTLKFEAFEFED